MAFYLGKRALGDLIVYEAAQPLKRYRNSIFTGAIGPFLSRLGAFYYARCKQGNSNIQTPADAERLAREDNTGIWPTIREMIEAEMLMTSENLAATRLDLACEYEPDMHDQTPQWVGMFARELCELRCDSSM
jgi:hypothetical protein